MNPRKIGPGRPKGKSRDTKKLIGDVASKLFAELGYDRTTVRLVADTANVDPKLVMHYFGNKQKLFVSTMKVPSEALAAITLLKLVPKREWGRQITNLIWLAQKSRATQTIVGVIRASASEPEAAQMFREFYLENLFLPITKSLSVDNKELRAVMMSSFMVGYVFNSEVLELFSGLKATESTKKKIFSAVLQTILTDKL